MVDSRGWGAGEDQQQPEGRSRNRRSVHWLSTPAGNPARPHRQGQAEGKAFRDGTNTWRWPVLLPFHPWPPHCPVMHCIVGRRNPDMPTLLNQNRVGYALEDLPIPATRLIPWDAATRPNADFRAHSADSRFLSPFLPLFPLDLLLLIAPLHASPGNMKRRGRSARGVFHPEPRSRSGDYPPPCHPPRQEPQWPSQPGRHLFGLLAGPSRPPLTGRDAAGEPSDPCSVLHEASATI